MVTSSPIRPEERASERAVPLSAILLLAVAVHAPLLLMQLPLSSYDANTHIFFASHYAGHWFDPWNDKWYGGFSQTTYPPLTHQWIGLLSHVLGLNYAYMLVQLIGVLLVVGGTYRFARLWVGERAATYAAIGSVFLGSLALLVYQSGQLPTTFACGLVLNSLPYFYEWNRNGRALALLKGLLIGAAAGAAHHVTLLFGSVLFALPVFVLSVIDRDDPEQGEEASFAGVVARGIGFAVALGVSVGLVLLPYWIALYNNPIKQMPIPHASRDNFLLVPSSGLNFWLIPMGALLIALPWIFLRGLERARLRPLFLGFYLTMLFGLGGTTPVARMLLGRAFEVLTFERFTFWATVMALPIAGLLATQLIDRYQRRAQIGLWIAAVLTFAIASGWTALRPLSSAPFRIDEVVSFLNRPEHQKFRYLTLGFGNNFSKVAARTDARTVDGDYNSARLLPELTSYGSAQLYNAKYFGANGMESLRAVLKHANQYGLKYIFVHDRFYEPLLAFAGWRQAETYDSGNVELWVKDDVPPAHPIESSARPTAFEGLLWGTLPLLTSLAAIFFVLFTGRERSMRDVVPFPARTGTLYREAQ